MKKYVLFCIAILQGLPSMVLSQENDSIPLRSLESPYTINKNLPAGTINGVADVSLSGAATYTIPIEIAHGEYGYWPSLQLVYNSQSGDGFLGVGWSLSGVSAISRCGKSHYYDGCAEEVHMSSSDNLLLDGKRLLLVSGNNLTEGAVYNLESDPTTKVVYHTVGSYQGFTVHLKDGSAIEYGLSDNSRLAQGNTAWLWKQNKSTDLRGRTITYTYEVNNTTNESYLTNISYDTNRYVRFIYEQQSNSYLSYFAGNCIETTKRLKKISSYARGSLMNEYRLTYSQDGSYSKLTDITFYGTDGSTHYNPIHITYGGESFEGEKVAVYSGIKEGAFVRYADFNGDGRTDFVSRPRKMQNAQYSSSDYAVVFLARDNDGILEFEKVDSICLVGAYDLETVDYDSDGIMDFVIDTPTNMGRLTNRFYGIDNNQILLKGSLETMSVYFMFGDYNGDGKTEMLNMYNQRVYNLNGEQIATAPSLNWDDVNKYGGYDPSTKYVNDFNGNGKEDILVCGTNGLHVYELSGNTIVELTSFAKNNFPNNRFLICGDINGDGYTDIISQGSANYDFKIYLSTGNTFVYNMTSFSASGILWTGDFNRDGKCDVFYYWVDNNILRYSVGISTGDNFVFSTYTPNLITLSDFDETWVKDLCSVADFDGDGRSEFAMLKMNSAAILNIDDEQDLLASTITDGLGKMVNYTYVPSSDSTVCTVNPEANNYPIINITRPINLVSVVETTDGSDSFNKSFRYNSPCVHVLGKGFMGFRETSTIDWGTEIKTTTTFDYNSTYYYPYISQRTVCTLNGDSISKDSSLVVCTPRASVHEKAFVPYVSNHISYDYLKGNNIETTNTIDGYGNLTYSNTSFSGGFYKRITNTFNNITDNIWLIGQPSTTNTVNVTSTSTWTDRQTYEYNSSHFPQKITSYTGDGYRKVSEETYAYDAHGNVTTYTIKPFSSSNTQTTTYQYVSDYVDLASVTDPQSLITSYNYDGRGRLFKTTLPTGKTITKTYDGLGRIVQEATNDSVIVTTSWNWGTSSSSPLYNQTVSGNDGSIQKTWYDAFGREVRNSTLCFDNTYLKTTRQYDTAGRLKRVSLPYKTGNASKWNTFAYDEFGRIVREQYATGKIVDYAYSGDSISTTTDGIPITHIYNQRGELIKVTDPKGDIVYSYRPDGQLKNVTALGVQTSFSYDLYGRQTSINDPSAGTRSFSYNSEGRISSETDADGRSVNYSYDVYGRVVQKVRPEMTTTYTYDNKSRLVGVSSNNGTGEVISYDSFGRKSSQRHLLSDGKYIQQNYTYSLGSISAVTYSNQSSQLGTERFTYSNGSLTDICFDNTHVWTLQEENNMGQCTTAMSGPITRTYNYNANGIQTGRMLQCNGTIMNFSYTFNPTTGNLTTRIDNRRGIGENFTYDNMNRLTGYAGNTVTYDDKGNILSKSDAELTLGYNHPNKPYAVTSVSQGFSPYAVRYSTQQISYNSFECPDTIRENSRMLTFIYNADGNRTRMKADGDDLPTRYYAGSFYEEEHLNGDSIYRLYLGGDAYSAPAVCIVKNGNKSLYYIGRDHLGSITHITDSVGTLVYEYSYDPWGCLRTPNYQENYSIGTEPELFLGRGYGSHEHLTDFGLINMNARLYDPVLGRFLNTDPFIQEAENSQNYNRYSYCLNNPLKYNDPDGELFWFVAGAALIGGIVNVAANWDNIQNFWHGASLFLSGSAGSGLAAVGCPMLGAAIEGVSTSVTNQLFTTGSLNFSQAVFAGIVSMSTQSIAQVLGDKLYSPISKMTYGIRNKTIKTIARDGVNGFMSGFILNSIISLGNGEDFKDVIRNGFRQGLNGALINIFCGLNNLLYKSRDSNKPKEVIFENSFFEDKEYNNHVLEQQIPSDPYHSIPDAVEAFESDGYRYFQMGDDGYFHERLDIPGWYRGKDGVFEFIKDENGLINHRYFNKKRIIK